MAHIDIIVKFNAPRAIQLNFFQCLTDHIVGLTLGALRRFDDSGLVKGAFVVDIEFAKGIRECEDFILLELRIFPICRSPQVSRAG